jgi:hypothetical protein
MLKMGDVEDGNACMMAHQTAHQAKILEYLAEMNQLAEDNLTGGNLTKIHSLMEKMKCVMCCAYKEFVLPSFRVQSSEFRADPKTYLRIAEERFVVVHGDDDDNIKLSFGCLDPLDSPMDSDLCEICLTTST